MSSMDGKDHVIGQGGKFAAGCRDNKAFAESPKVLLD